MAKIVRSTQKIFGVNAAQNQITEFGSIKAGAPVYSQNVANIQTAAFEGGWSDALQDDYAPYRQDRNAVDLVTTSQLAYLFQEGVPEWDAGTVYYKGSLAKVTTSAVSVQLYMSKVDNNTANYFNTDNWTKILDTANSYALSSEVVKLTGAQTVAGVKTFSNIPKISATIGSTDNTTQVPTTAWVNSRINNIINTNSIRFPKYNTGVNIAAPTSSATYTCPYDLLYVACIQHSGSNAFLELYVDNSASGIGFHNSDSYSPLKDSVTAFLKKGQVIYWSGTVKNTFVSRVFQLN